MENIKFIGAQNEIQKIYSDLGLIVPVGDLDNGKAPGFKVYEVKYNEDGEDSAVNATIQIYCNSEGGGIYALYKTSDIEELFPDGVPTDYDLDAAINDPESQDPILGKTQYAYGDISFRKDMYTLSMPTNNDDYTSAVLPYDDYTLIMSIYTCPLECMTTTVTSQFSAVAPPNWATTDEVLEGNKFIGEDGQEAVGTYVAPEPVLSTLNVTENGTYSPETGVDGFSEVTVNVGPTDGGVTVQSCTMENVQIDGMDIPRHTIVLDTMPEDIDPENHRYGVKVFALCYSSTSTDPFNNPDIEHLANISGTELAEFDLENNTIYDYFCGSPQDQNFQDIASTSGYVVLYEDSFINPIYKWPCTITTPVDSQQ